MSEKKYDYEEFSKQDLINWIELCHELLDSHGITYDNHGALYSVYGRLNLYEEKTNAELATLTALLKEAGEALEPFAVTEPIGVANWWMKDFRRAAEIRKKIQEVMG